MENDNNYDVRLMKIPLHNLLDMLHAIYNKGVDYIDILGVNNVEQDTLTITYSKDYLAKEEDKQDPPADLSDENLNQFI